MSINFGGTALAQLFKTIWNISVPISCTLGTATNPTVITTDTWHPMSLQANWSTSAGQAIPSYKMGPDKRVYMSGFAQFNVNIANTALATPLPVGPYRPASQYIVAGACDSAQLQVSSNGGLVAFNGPLATKFCNFNGSYPLDL